MPTAGRLFPWLTRAVFFLLVLLFFSAILVPGTPAADTPIAFGQTISASIDTAGETDVYTFNALAGDSVVVVMSTTSSLDSHLRLFASGGGSGRTRTAERHGYRNFSTDLDPSTTTDPLDADSDDDELLDGEEDTNYNGRVDTGEKIRICSMSMR